MRHFDPVHVYEWQLMMIRQYESLLERIGKNELTLILQLQLQDQSL